MSNHSPKDSFQISGWSKQERTPGYVVKCHEVSLGGWKEGDEAMLVLECAAGAHLLSLARASAGPGALQGSSVERQQHWVMNFTTTPSPPPPPPHLHTPQTWASCEDLCEVTGHRLMTRTDRPVVMWQVSPLGYSSCTWGPWRQSPRGFPGPRPWRGCWSPRCSRSQRSGAS